MAVSLSTAQEQLETWLAADLAIATGQSYTIGNRALNRADAAEVRNKITYWQRAVITIEAGNAGARNPGQRIATWN